VDKENIEEKRESCLTPVVYDDVYVLVFALAIRDSEENRKDKELAQLLRAAFGMDIGGEPTGKLV